MHITYTTQELRTLDKARKIMESKAMYRTEYSGPAPIKALLQLTLGHLEREVFQVLFMDCQHRLIASEQLFAGTIDASGVYPREVVKRALELNAAAVIFGHNHPSGIPEPSQADQRITIRLRDALSLVDIRTLDHVIVGAPDVEPVSMAERGLL